MKLTVRFVLVALASTLVFWQGSLRNAPIATSKHHASIGDDEVAQFVIPDLKLSDIERGGMPK